MKDHNFQPDQTKSSIIESTSLPKRSKVNNPYITNMAIKFEQFQKALKQENHLRHRLQKENEQLKIQLKEIEVKINQKDLEYIKLLQQNTQLNKKNTMITSNFLPKDMVEVSQQVDSLMGKPSDELKIELSKILEAYTTLTHNYEQLQKRSSSDKDRLEKQLTIAKETINKHSCSSQKYKLRNQKLITKLSTARSELENVKKTCQQEHSFIHLASLLKEGESTNNVDDEEKNGDSVTKLKNSKKQNRELRKWKKELRRLGQLLLEKERQLQEQRSFNATLAKKTFYYKTKFDSLDILIKRYQVTLVEGNTTQPAQILIKKIATTGEVLLIVETKNSDNFDSSNYVQDMSTISLRIFNVEMDIDEEFEINDAFESVNDSNVICRASGDEGWQGGKLKRSESEKKSEKKTMKKVKYQFELIFTTDGHKTMVFQCKTLRKRNKYCLAIQEMIETTKKKDPYRDSSPHLFKNEVKNNDGALNVEGKRQTGWKGSSCDASLPTVSSSSSSVSSANSSSQGSSPGLSVSSVGSWPSGIPRLSEIDGIEGRHNLGYENCLDGNVPKQLSKVLSPGHPGGLQQK